MKNFGMGNDPRAVANALLDIADSYDIAVTNLSLNKLIFFIHTDCMIEKTCRLSSLTFEAWKFGPVLPIVYHQFKRFKRDPITSRATRTDPKTGRSVIVDYDDLCVDAQYLEDRFLQYSRLSPSNLIALSHEPGGAWDAVWNGIVENVGMKITDELILRYNYRGLESKGDSDARLH